MIPNEQAAALVTVVINRTRDGNAKWQTDRTSAKWAFHYGFLVFDATALTLQVRAADGAYLDWGITDPRLAALRDLIWSEASAARKHHAQIVAESIIRELGPAPAPAAIPSFRTRRRRWLHPLG